MMTQQIDREELQRLWEHALAEDGADRDLTSRVTTDEHVEVQTQWVSRQTGVFAGRVILDLLGDVCKGQLAVTSEVNDSDRLEGGTVIATLTGPVRLLLSIERTLLNFLQRLSGVATLTRQYVDAVAGTQARIYDTRKTIPGWRQLDKYAVRCGGGSNHRMGLHDAILVKDNHIVGVPTSRLAAAALEMIARIKALDASPTFVEFEVDTLEQLDELLEVVGIDVILLDNFTPEQMREAVTRRNAKGLVNKVQLEASGGVDLEHVRAIAETGVDRIAIGAITHSVPALDISMEIWSGSRPNSPKVPAG